MLSVLGVVGVVLFGVGCFIAYWKLRRRELGDLEKREPLDDATIYARYYGSSGLQQESVREVWHEIADSLRLPASKLRPSDRFGKEIGKYLFTSDDLDWLSVQGNRRVKRLSLTVDLKTLMTVDDYVRALASKKGA